MHMRLPLRGKSFLTLISAYAPTMTNSDEEKERFYGDLDKTIASVPSSDKLLIMGDFNARVGRDNVTWQKGLGSHGVGKENSNGNLLLSECIKHSLAITNKHTSDFLQRRERHGCTQGQNSDISLTL